MTEVAPRTTETSAAPFLKPGLIAVSKVAAREFRVTVAGIWTPEYADAHFDRLRCDLHRARTPALGVRVLIDMRDAAVQPMATADRVGYWTETIYEPRDRVAIIVASSLLKQQMRRVAVIAARELFFSEGAALTWLRATDPETIG